MKKSATVLAAALLPLVSFVLQFAGGSAQAAPARPGSVTSEWCDHHAPPCVVSASRSGTAISESDPTPAYAVSAAGSLQPGGEFLTQWSIAAAQGSGPYATLPTSDTGVPFSITVNVGPHPPRVVDEYADDVSVTKSFNSGAGTWDVTISGRAVKQGVNADCDTNQVPWTCPPNETNTIVAFQGEIGDWQQWSDSAQWNDFNGLNQWTNVELTEIPPQITGSPVSISEQLA